MNNEVSTLYHNLLKLHNELRDDKQKNWNRVIPFEELLFDRWEKAKFLKSGKKASIYHSSYIFGDVKIKENAWIGPFTIIDGSAGKIKIGKYCSISSGVQIYTHDSVNWSLTGGKAKMDSGDIYIGDNCYIGPNSIISRGSHIGKNSIIGANSLVNSKIPTNSIAFGTPAKIVGKVSVKGTKVKKYSSLKNR